MAGAHLLQFAAAFGIDQRKFNHRVRPGPDLKGGEANLISRPCSDNAFDGSNPAQNSFSCCDNLSSLRCNWMVLNAGL